MGVAHHPIDRSGDVSATNVANNRSVSCLEARCVLTQPIIVLDGCFDPTIAGYLYAHALQKWPRIAQIFQKLAWRAFPEVHVKRLVLNNFRTRRKVHNLRWHRIPPLTTGFKWRTNYSIPQSSREFLLQH